MKKRFILIVVFLLVISQFSFGDNNNRFRAFIYDFNLVPNLVSGDIGFSLSAQKPAKYIGGSGTANYIPKFTDAMTIGNSAIYEKDGKVGIGTTSPVGKLTVHTGINDGIYLRDTSNNYKVKILNAYEGDGVIELVNAIPFTGVSLKSGGDSYFTGGNVGIGTTRPNEKLDINGNLGFKTGANRYIKFPDNLKSLFIGSSTSEKGPYAIHLITHDITSGKGKERISILGDKVGIGTTSPNEKLDISGNLGFKTGANRYIKFPDNLRSLFIGSSTSEKGPYAIHLITHDITSGKGKERISILGDKVGIGTTDPEWGRLQIKDEAVPLAFRETDYTGAGSLWRMPLDDTRLRFDVSQNGVNFDGYKTPLTMTSRGYVGIGTLLPSRKLTIHGGNLLIRNADGIHLVELGEGLDFAEGFNVTAKEGIAPGSVLVIDSDNHGKLTLSDKPYDSKVAGIVSGANNIGSAVRVGGQFDYDVALAGRVYCNVDATYGEVTPGDLLTTSPTPGYAMVVKDNFKAQGAILGKAMEGLEKDQKGQILVLVTLQ